MYAGGIDEGLNTLVPQNVLRTQVLGHVDEQLAAQHFVAVHVAHQLDLWLHYGLQTDTNIVQTALMDLWIFFGPFRDKLL